MREAVFHPWASSWYCSILIALYIVGLYCQLWRMGMIHVRVLGILYQKRAQAARGGQTILFRFYLSVLKPYLSHSSY